MSTVVNCFGGSGTQGGSAGLRPAHSGQVDSHAQEYTARFRVAKPPTWQRSNYVSISCYRGPPASAQHAGIRGSSDTDKSRLTPTPLNHQAWHCPWHRAEIDMSTCSKLQELATNQLERQPFAVY